MMFRNSTEWISLPIGAIKPYRGHARRHNKRQLKKLKQLIRQFGQVVPVVVDRDNVLVDGHAVWTVMRELGSGEIAAVIVCQRQTLQDIQAEAEHMQSFSANA